MSGEVIINPKIGAEYQIWYRKSNSHLPLHGKIGIVRIRCYARPRNHGIEIDDEIYVVPCGNLRKFVEGRINEPIM